MRVFRAALLSTGTAIALAACVPAAPGGNTGASTAPALPDPANDSCAARAAGQLIGLDAAAVTSIAARRDPVRVISPGQPVTMDYNQARLNVELDDTGRIVRLTCG